MKNFKRHTHAHGQTDGEPVTGASAERAQRPRRRSRQRAETPAWRHLGSHLSARPPGNAIVAERLSKSFGTVDALIDMTLVVGRGEVFGFLGPNGAGKSTTIKLFLDELRPTRGSVRLLDLDSHTDLIELHRRVGYLPGELSLPGDLTGEQFLKYIGELRGSIEPTFRDELIERFAIDTDRRIDQLSTGNKQKLGLVQAFMHRPELVLLDEPTRGLDPLIQHEFQLLLREMAAADVTTFLSSHTLSEVERVADRVGILRHGRLATVRSVDELKAQARRRVDIEFSDEPRKQILLSASGVLAVDITANHAKVTLVGAVDDLLRRALHAGTILSVQTPQADLEDIFLNHYRDEAVPELS